MTDVSYEYLCFSTTERGDLIDAMNHHGKDGFRLVREWFAPPSNAPYYAIMEKVTNHTFQ